MAKQETFTFLSKDGKTNIHGVRWIPDSGEYKAVLQIAHGMIEYIERYALLAEYMTLQGYLVVGHDHLGHGESVTSKEDWGYFAEDHPSDTLIGDMHTLRTMTQKENPQKPYFMMGHSMGSYMLRKYLSLYGEGIDGAIIMGTGYIPDREVKIAMRAAKISARRHGWRHRSEFIRNLTFGKPYRKFDLNGKDTSNSWLTKDTEVLKEYYANPKCKFIFTLNGYMGLFEAVLFDNQPENIEKIPKNLPLFLISGADDPVGNLGKGVMHVYETYKNAGIADVTCKLYENDRHEIINETDRENVYQDIASWLNAHLKNR